MNPLIHLLPVVQKVENAIHWINHYPADDVVCFVNTYLLDRWIILLAKRRTSIIYIRGALTSLWRIHHLTQWLRTGVVIREPEFESSTRKH